MKKHVRSVIPSDLNLSNTTASLLLNARKHNNRQHDIKQHKCLLSFLFYADPKLSVAETN